MKILAIDTATEQCSAAIYVDGQYWSRLLPTARGHADTILPMVDELLSQSNCRLGDLAAIAFGRGPGSFTGVRVAVSVAQGLAFGAGLPLVGISNLAAVAQQAVNDLALKAGARVAVCMDARMKEVYWATYRVDDEGRVCLEADERVVAPSELGVESAQWDAAVGTGWQAYPGLETRLALASRPVACLPRATEIAQLAVPEVAAGRVVSPAAAEPVYLRDNVVTIRDP